MKKVFFSKNGTASLTKTESTEFVGELHFYQRKNTSFQDAIDQFNFDQGSVNDAISFDRDWAYRASQSPYTNGSVFFFENIKKT